MGMYTEFHVNLDLKSDLPLDLQIWLKDWCKKPPTKAYDGHPFFKTTRWNFFPRAGSMMFPFEPYSEFFDRSIGTSKIYAMSIHCQLKNYDEEIGQFLGWILPFCEPDQFIGYKRYEEDKDPTLLYIQTDGTLEAIPTCRNL